MTTRPSSEKVRPAGAPGKSLSPMTTPEAPTVTPEERVLMRHALGLDQAKRAYRNRYAAPKATPVRDAFEYLTKRSLAERGADTASLVWFSLTEAGITAVTEPNEREQCRFVYRSKRGALGIVHAAFVAEAWGKANKKHAVDVLWSDEGAAWVKATNGKPVRENGLDQGESEMTAMRGEVDAKRGGVAQ